MEWEFLNYALPEEQIAQQPVGEGEARSHSRLLASRGDGRLEERRFDQLCELLTPGDLLILNNTCVSPARFFVARESGSEAEVLLLNRERLYPDGGEEWVALARPLRRLRAGELLNLGEGLAAECLGRTSDDTKLRLLLRADAPNTVSEAIHKCGLMPIPPYIRDGRAGERDREWYQTVFAKVEGSVAAPTASLHFTPRLLSQIEEMGVQKAFVTLHVGSASFLPIRDSVETHRMAVEQYCVSSETWRFIKEAKGEGRRVIAVGTTAVRTLESASRLGAFDQWCATELFITPGFDFHVVDAMVTNFHQPRSTHLLLVASFAGFERIERAYQYALREKFRFLSYGDSMFLERGGA